jgi:uncharacterized protein YjbJ (UPF0337 family)
MDLICVKLIRFKKYRIHTHFLKEKIMGLNVSSSNWPQLKLKLQESWNKITDEDLDLQEIKRQHIVEKLQVKYSLKKEQAENALKNWEIKNRNFL